MQMSAEGGAVTQLRGDAARIFITGSCCLVLTLGCTRYLPATVTCQGLRSLTIGMSMGDVEKGIGVPVFRTPGQETSRPSDEELWDYEVDRPLGGVALHLEFKGGRLQSVVGYRKYRWNERSKLLFWLDKDWREETPELPNYINCS
jgi:hypothetical protein